MLNQDKVILMQRSYWQELALVFSRREAEEQRLGLAHRIYITSQENNLCSSA